MQFVVCTYQLEAPWQISYYGKIYQFIDIQVSSNRDTWRRSTHSSAACSRILRKNLTDDHPSAHHPDSLKNRTRLCRRCWVIAQSQQSFLRCRLFGHDIFMPSGQSWSQAPSQQSQEFLLVLFQEILRILAWTKWLDSIWHKWLSLKWCNINTIEKKKKKIKQREGESSNCNMIDINDDPANTTTSKNNLSKTQPKTCSCWWIMQLFVGVSGWPLADSPTPPETSKTDHQAREIATSQASCKSPGLMMVTNASSCPGLALPSTFPKCIFVLATNMFKRVWRVFKPKKLKGVHFINNFRWNQSLLSNNTPTKLVKRHHRRSNRSVRFSERRGVNQPRGTIMGMHFIHVYTISYNTRKPSTRLQRALTTPTWSTTKHHVFQNFNNKRPVLSTEMTPKVYLLEIYSCCMLQILVGIFPDRQETLRLSTGSQPDLPKPLNCRANYRWQFTKSRLYLNGVANSSAMLHDSNMSLNLTMRVDSWINHSGAETWVSFIFRAGLCSVFTHSTTLHMYKSVTNSSW